MENNWIKKTIINNWITKNELKVIDIQSFFDNYSLHDSYLINFYANGIDETICIFQIDPFWAKEFEEYQTGELEDWPYILLKFINVKNIKTEFKNHSMNMGFSGTKIICNDEDVIVNLVGTHGDNYEITTSKQIKYFCFNKRYKKITLKDVIEI
jgi:hypothetical protein